jgi:glutamyl-tRNA reductase
MDDDSEAVEHLFKVSVGLEAQVVGDMQIANQVKRAYQASADLDMAGPFLHRLMHTIFLPIKGWFRRLHSEMGQLQYLMPRWSLLKN